jgi:hypothetical protein
MVQMPGQEAFIYAATPRYILQCSTERKHGCKAIRTETIKDVHESYGLGYFAGSDGSKYIYAGFELNGDEAVTGGHKVFWFRS